MVRTIILFAAMTLMCGAAFAQNASRIYLIPAVSKAKIGEELPVEVADPKKVSDIIFGLSKGLKPEYENYEVHGIHLMESDLRTLTVTTHNTQMKISFREIYAVYNADGISLKTIEKTIYIEKPGDAIYICKLFMSSDPRSFRKTIENM